jgi:hypothetical protein
MGPDPRQIGSGKGASVSAHLDASLKLAFTNMLPDGDVTAVSLEFGTLPPMDVFKALRADNWLYHHGGPDHPMAGEIKTSLLQTFHPADAEWAAQVWALGKEVTEQVIAWTASLPGRRSER